MPIEENLNFQRLSLATTAGQWRANGSSGLPGAQHLIAKFARPRTLLSDFMALYI